MKIPSCVIVATTCALFAGCYVVPPPLPPGPEGVVIVPPGAPPCPRPIVEVRGVAPYRTAVWVPGAWVWHGKRHWVWRHGYWR